MLITADVDVRARRLAITGVDGRHVGVELDSGGFVTTRGTFATSIDGLFAVGDVRAGSVKRVASAVGEGSVVVSAVHSYLGTLPD